VLGDQLQDLLRRFGRQGIPGAGGPGAEAGAGAAAGSTSGGGEPKGDVIDAEVVDEGKQ